MLLNKNQKVIITGASGWIGRNIVHHILQLFPKSYIIHRIFLFASRSSSLDIVNMEFALPILPLSSLSEVVKETDDLLIFHAAFLTPDRITSLGVDSFISINRDITRSIENAVRKSNFSRVVLFSSGMASLKEMSKVDKFDSKFIYGSLKREEEDVISKMCPALILRIYALSGRYARNLQNYALGDFILQAMYNKKLLLKNSSLVLRGYVHVSCLAQMATKWIFSDLNSTPRLLNATTHEIEISELAKLVANFYGGLEIKYTKNAGTTESIYSADPSEFLKLLYSNSINIPSMEHQIADTASSLSPPSLSSEN